MKAFDCRIDKLNNAINDPFCVQKENLQIEKKEIIQLYKKIKGNLNKCSSY